MSTGNILGAAFAGLGFFLPGGSFLAAQAGWMLGNIVGGIVDPPEGPSPGDLSAPNIAQGASLPRVYGTVRVVANPTWISPLVAVANDTGGKGGPPEGSAGYAYYCDLLCTLADGLNVLAMTRIWVNKKLVWTALAASSASSLAASAVTDSWEAATLFTGAVDQMPWSIYETAVTTANAVAYRHQCTIGFQGLALGGSKTPPLIEVELVTSATPTVIPPKVLLQVDFNDNIATDLSCYDSAITTHGTDFSIAGGQFNLAGTWGEIEWNAAQLAIPLGEPYTMQAHVVIASLDGGGEPNHLLFLGDPIDPETVIVSAHAGPVVRMGVYGNFTADYSVASHVAVEHDGVDTWWFYVDGAMVEAITYTPTIPVAASFSIGRVFTGGTSEFSIDNVRLEQQAVWEGASFTPPTDLPEVGACDLTVYAPATVDLKTIVDAELALNTGIAAADHDTSDLAGIAVRGYTALGAPAKTIAELADIFYFDVVPANPIRYTPRGAATVDAIAQAHTGVGVNEAGKPFAGLKRGNNDEIAAVVGLKAPNYLQDHEPVFERGDRLTTDGPDIARRETLVVLEPTEVKGRAIAASLMARAAAHTSEFGISDRYAESEPGDAYTVADELGNTYNLLIQSFSYADGVRQGKWQLNDLTALVETGITDETYTPSIVVVAPVDSTLVAIDGPILRDEDDNPGAYTAVEGEGEEAFPGAKVRRSVDDLDFSEIVATHPVEAVVGTASTALGNWTGGYVWDETNTVTVTVGDGQTLASSTAAAMQSDRTINTGFLGVHGRWEVIRFRTATLMATAVYKLSGLLRGMRGTEAHMGAHAIGDRFVMATYAGLRRISGEVSTIGQLRYLKAVTDGRAVASATSQAFTNEAVGLLPFSPTNLRAARDGSGNITFTVDRRDRLFPRYGGSGGSYIPMSEDTEAYELDVYATSGYATVLRTLTSSDGSFAYSAANQTTDFGSTQTTVYTRSYQLSAQVGRGNYLQASA